MHMIPHTTLFAGSTTVAKGTGSHGKVAHSGHRQRRSLPDPQTPVVTLVADVGHAPAPTNASGGTHVPFGSHIAAAVTSHAGKSQAIVTCSAHLLINTLRRNHCMCGVTSLALLYHQRWSAVCVLWMPLQY